ncbi:hypothetical protein [Pseudomonas fluorescens]|uniref:Uncharacterized protein n=1 Tax=Pseudomonas fluorescens TaxID=294 RepID=A0A5E7LAD5_PSEFL|nr:hypothetical protein [Pseudomonas fluorescens]VVP04964.1 hypothetical protein PS880_03015 [Pseudomonas fluorescens]
MPWKRKTCGGELDRDSAGAVNIEGACSIAIGRRLAHTGCGISGDARLVQCPPQSKWLIWHFNAVDCQAAAADWRQRNTLESAAGTALWRFNSLNRQHQISGDVLQKMWSELDLTESNLGQVKKRPPDFPEARLEILPGHIIRIFRISAFRHFYIQLAFLILVLI